MFALSRAGRREPAAGVRGHHARRTAAAALGADQRRRAGLVVAMALLEVVLLAGPAFAVGARTAAARAGPDGGQRRPSRRTCAGWCWPAVSCSGRPPRCSASALGVGVAWLARPLVQRLQRHRARTVRGVAARHRRRSRCAACSAPAGRAAAGPARGPQRRGRGARRSPRRDPDGPLVAGARRRCCWPPGSPARRTARRRPSGGEVLDRRVRRSWPVLGMVLLTPLVLGVLGRLARLAAAACPVRGPRRRAAPQPDRARGRRRGRDRGRRRRAGVGGASDAAQNRAHLRSERADGCRRRAGDSVSTAPDWTAFERAVHRQLPDGTDDPRHGCVDESGDVIVQIRASTLAADSAPMPATSAPASSSARRHWRGLRSVGRRRRAGPAARWPTATWSSSAASRGRDETEVELVRETRPGRGRRGHDATGRRTRLRPSCGSPGLDPAGRAVVLAAVAWRRTPDCPCEHDRPARRRHDDRHVRRGRDRRGRGRARGERVAVRRARLPATTLRIVLLRARSRSAACWCSAAP